MVKRSLILVLLISRSVFSQSADTLLNQEGEITKDTTKTSEIIDTTNVRDSSKVVKQVFAPDTLAPLQEIPLSGANSILSKKSFLFENYRYTGDFLRLFPLHFIKDRAFIGQRDESFVYGAGFGGITFMEDGLLWNDRYTNSLNLNYVQSEDIDSIEIISLARGFLFGPYNNPVSVNFIMKDFISPEPYTRIRYYEGPDGEAMIDGKFNARIYKRWNLSFQVTNRAADDRYINTDYSMWQINAKIKYFLSNSINITAIYKSVDSEIGLNGGVNVDSIASITTDINSVLYDNQEAIVNYPNRIQKILQHNFRLKTQILPWKDSRLNISVFYRYSDNETSNDLDTIVLKERYDNKSFGAALNFSQKINMFSFQLLSNYEGNEILEYASHFLSSDLLINQNYFSISSILSVNLLEEKLVPSVFYKYSRQSLDEYLMENPVNNSGLGFDINYKPFESLSLYSGYSLYKQFDKDDAVMFEAGSKFQLENIFANIKYFVRSRFIPYFIKPPGVSYEQLAEPSSVKGLGIVMHYKLWKILVEANAAHYFDFESSSPISLPEFQFNGGIFVNDIFFDNDLLLKAGIKFYYTGKHSSFVDETGFVDVDPSNKIDFTLVGEIRNAAIVYFIWENLAGNNYFITPYYPMPERSIRFGVNWELYN